jgi:hypothetical protein
MMYKVLLAVPRAADAGVELPCGTNAPTPVDTAHLVPPTAVSDLERQTLANFILGREMPYPNDPSAPLPDNTQSLTDVQLERLSLWIAQAPPAAGPIPATCNCQ